MLVRLLGTVDIVDGDTVIAVPGERRRAVLAALALRPDDLVSVARIVDAVWDEEPPATVTNTVQSHIAFLRRCLGGGATIVHRQPGYVLRLPGAGTDVRVVEGLLAEARRGPDRLARVDLMERALRTWRGPSLADVAGTDCLSRSALRLDELRWSATELVLAELLRLGRHHEVVDRAEELASAHPDRERPVEILMTALHRCGRRSQALAAYDRYRDALRAVAGVAPGATIEALHVRILRGDPPARTRTDAPPPSTSGSSGTSATGRPGLWGRDREVAAVRALLAPGRVVTIVGMAGVGKTRLAQEVLAAPGDSGPRAFVDLSVVTGGAEREVGVWAAIAASVDRSGVAPGEDPRDAVLSALAGSSRTLLLDNCEHLGALGGRVVTDLLGQLPGLSVLATSREPLHLEVEQRFPLGPLPTTADGDRPSPALGLLLRRARAVDPDFRPAAEELAALAELVVAVDGLPLALTILGARLSTMTPAELVEGLGDRLLEWRLPGADVADRHRSLRSLVQWSHDLLDEEASEVLGLLATLRGGGWLSEVTELAATVADDGERVVGLLLDKSLVQRRLVEGRTRVVLHPLVRAFVEQSEAARGRAPGAALTHARWVLDLLRADGRIWHTAEEERRVRWRTTDRGNVEAAMEWAAAADPQLLAELVTNAWWWSYRSGEARQALRWAEVAVEAAASRGVDDAALLHAVAGYLAWQLDEYALAEEHAGLALGFGTRSAAVVGLAHGVRARVEGDSGRFDECVAAALSSVRAFEDGGLAWETAWSRRLLAAGRLYAGDLDAARHSCLEALDGFSGIGDRWGEAGARTLAARIAASDGDLAAAVVQAAAAAQTHHEIGDTSGERSALQHLAEWEWALGRVEEARSHAAASLALSRDHGYAVGALQATLLLEDAARALGDDGAAAQHEQSAHDMVVVLGDRARVSLEIAARRRQAPGAGGASTARSRSASTG